MGSPGSTPPCSGGWWSAVECGMCNHDLAELRGAGPFSWRGSSRKGEGCSLAAQLRQLTFPVNGVGDANWWCVCREGQSRGSRSCPVLVRRREDNDEMARKKRRSAAEVVPGIGMVPFYRFLTRSSRDPCQSVSGRGSPTPLRRPSNQDQIQRRRSPQHDPVAALFQAVEIGVAG